MIHIQQQQPTTMPLLNVNRIGLDPSDRESHHCYLQPFDYYIEIFLDLHQLFSNPKCQPIINKLKSLQIDSAKKIFFCFICCHFTTTKIVHSNLHKAYFQPQSLSQYQIDSSCLKCGLLYGSPGYLAHCHKCLWDTQPDIMQQRFDYLPQMLKTLNLSPHQHYPNDGNNQLF
jgi:hypothetical protein